MVLTFLTPNNFIKLILSYPLNLITTYPYHFFEQLIINCSFLFIVCLTISTSKSFISNVLSLKTPYDFHFLWLFLGNCLLYHIIIPNLIYNATYNWINFHFYYVKNTRHSFSYVCVFCLV